MELSTNTSTQINKHTNREELSHKLFYFPLSLIFLELLVRFWASEFLVSNLETKFFSP